jgi:hypothetical protein
MRDPNSGDWLSDSGHYINITLSKDGGEEEGGGATPTSSQSEEPSATSTGTRDDSDGQGDSGLSAGAVAGISVGASIAGTVLLGLLAFMLWRRFHNRRHHHAGGTVAAAAGSWWLPKPSPGSGASPETFGASTPAHIPQPPHEVEQSGYPYELPQESHRS